MEPQQVTPTVPQPVPVEQKQPHSNKNVKIMILVFLFLLLGAVITYAFQNYQPQPQSDLLPHPEDIPTATPETELKTYRNEEYGFEFQYPAQLKIDDLSTQSQFYTDILEVEDNNSAPVLLITYLNNPTKLSLEDFNEQFIAKNKLEEGQGPIPPMTDLTKTTLGELNEAYLQQNYFCEPSYCSRYFLPYEDKIFTIFIFESLSGNKLLADQILSSFRFVEGSVNNSGAQTYSDPVAGFSIQYPSSYEIFETYPGESVTIKRSGYFPLHVYRIYLENYSGEPLREWFDSKHDFSSYDTTYEDYTVAGVQALIVIADDPGSMSGTYALIPKGDKVYTISRQSGIKESEEVKQFVSTFKFLE